MTREALEPCPCPLCGIPLELFGVGRYSTWEHSAPEYEGCLLEGMITLRDEDDITAWNTRPPNPLQAEVDALRVRVAELREPLAWFINDIDDTHTSMLDFSANVELARATLKQEPTP